MPRKIDAFRDAVADALEAPARSARKRRDLAVVRQERVDGALAILANATPGVRWPWPSLNMQTDTLVPGTVILMAAYTGSGKTTVALNAVQYWSKSGHEVLYFGTEQSASSLTLKTACMDLGVPYADAIRGRLSAHWVGRVEAAVSEQAASSVTYYPHNSPTVSDVEAAIRASAREARRAGKQLVVVLDYLGHFDLGELRGDFPQRNRDFAKLLKKLAVELSIIVVECAQVGAGDLAGSMIRHTKPEIAQIQGGTGIQQEADVILGVYAPLKRDVTEEQRAGVRAGHEDLSTIVEPYTAAIALLKHREGAMLGSTSLFWVRHNRLYQRKRTDRILPPELELSEYERDRMRRSSLIDDIRELELELREETTFGQPE